MVSSKSLRSLGQNPTESEVADIINEVDADRNGVLEFREFVMMMSSRITNETMEQELKEAFRYGLEGCVLLSCNWVLLLPIIQITSV